MDKQPGFSAYYIPRQRVQKQFGNVAYRNVLDPHGQFVFVINTFFDQIIVLRVLSLNKDNWNLH